LPIIKSKKIKMTIEWFKSILAKITRPFKNVEPSPNDYFRVLHETERMILGHVNDYVSLIEKYRNDIVFDTHIIHGELICGIISQKNDWCIVCGSHSFILWTPEGTASFEDADLFSPYDLRQIDDDTVEILIDPWGKKAAIWRFNIVTEHAFKVRDFDDYKDKEYTDNVEW
jgi:hypothetical protein